MAISETRVKRGYGLSPLIDIFPAPIIAKRSPTVKDHYDLGTCWIDTVGQDVYFNVKHASGSTVWINSGGGGGAFDSLDITGAAVIGTDLTVGGATTLNLTAGTVRTSDAGLVSVLADGADGTVMIGTTGGVPTWGTLTAGGGITIAESAGGITISNPGVTGTTFGTDVGGPVAPDGAGLTTIVGDGVNITTDGTVANEIAINLADNIISVGSITASQDFDVLTGTTTILSDTNAANAIVIQANAGVNETVRIISAQGTSIESVQLLSVAGGIALGGGIADVAISILASNAAGKIEISAGTGGTEIININGPHIIETGTANISIGEDAADHDIGIGDDSGVNIMNLVSGTGGSSTASTGPILIDAAGVLEFNSSAGIVSIANDDIDQNVNIATQGERVVSIGNAQGVTQVVVDCGTAGASFGANATAHTTTIGSVTAASALTLQSGTGAATITAGGIFDVNAVGAVTIDSTGGTLGIGVGADANNISIGTGAAARILTLGNITGISSTIINVGTGNLDLGVSATTHTTRLGSTSGASDTIIQSGTGTMVCTSGGDFSVNATGSLSLNSIEDAARAIYLNTNAGVTETIELENTQGTDAAAIGITATAGGVTITADTATGIVLSAAGSVSITADTGTAAASAITLNKRRGVVTLTGLTTASGATQRYTITNSVCQATSGLHVNVSNKSAGNDCKITKDADTPGAGSFTVDTINSGSQALDSDVIITFEIVN